MIRQTTNIGQSQSQVIRLILESLDMLYLLENGTITHNLPAPIYLEHAFDDTVEETRDLG